MIDTVIRELVRGRAGDRCEYCHLRQADLPYATFHVEHIVPRKHGGTDDATNLALACDRCNFSKGVNLTGIDPESAQLTPLFNPREHIWSSHFIASGAAIVGLTAIGRTTARVLNMNEPRRLRLRAVLEQWEDT